MRKRIGPRLTYANVVASIALFAALGGGAYATHTHRMGTQDLQNRAVTAPKVANNAVVPRAIRNNAVRRAKIRNRAVSGPKIARNARGVAVAGVNVGSGGQVRSWFNRFGGAPSVDWADPGSYTITFPGLEGRLVHDESLAVASLIAGAAQPGTIRRTSTGLPDEGDAVIRTTNADGTPTNRAFEFVVIVPSAP